MDWINEVANALVLHFTDRAAVWTTTGDTSFQILVGLNIEISFMFLIYGIVFVKFLPPDPALRILGVPNRVFMVLVFLGLLGRGRGAAVGGGRVPLGVLVVELPQRDV